ncbi:hypothetical protein GGS20DRAFT_549534 [Poronia punctata]|nr:hypothetical protein GGS20DRAFT_549534 [Poronia punctata]
MPSATEGPTVAISFANNFWGKDDAGVGPLLDRMACAKQTSDELRSFYGARASIEDDYARKLMSLSRKALGSHEMGSLKASLDTVRGEVESMAKQHAGIAAQMKTELEEPLAAFAGGMKERRKIIQHTVEKLLKVKIQQTNTVNKTRDRYEQDCLRIKGYLAQGHMVMGQEERKNKAKLEKTQISLASTNAEYESAVKALEDTTARWNREWKAAADKFQDLEEERLDFTKSSLWTFANIASTVCVSDDASCEKIRLSLEKMDVEQDIAHFITERGTGQEIPDAPKYINFCRGDVDDHRSEVSDDDNYSVAQFPRSINPAFRSSSPQPSTYESHHDPNSALARDLAHQEPVPRPEQSALPPQSTQGIPLHNLPQTIPPRNDQQMVPAHHGHPQMMPPRNEYQAAPLSNGHQTIPPHGDHQVMLPHNGHPQAFPSHGGHFRGGPPPNGHYQTMPPQNGPHQAMPPPTRHVPTMPQQDRIASQERRAIHSMQDYDAAQFSTVPHDPYPMDGMTMLCRTDGMNAIRNTNGPLRFDGMKSATTPNMPPALDQPPPSSVSANTQSAVRQERQERQENMEVAENPVAPSRREGIKVTAKLAQRFANPNSAVTTATHTTPARFEAPAAAASRPTTAVNTTSKALSRPDVVPPPTALEQPADNYEAINSATSSNLSTGDGNSEYSNPTSFSSQEPPSGKVSPVKAEEPPAPEPEKRMMKKKSGFFQNHSPFRRKSTKEAQPSTKNRNTWGPVASQDSSTPRRPQLYQSQSGQQSQESKPSQQTQPGQQSRPGLSSSLSGTQNIVADRTAASPEPIDADSTLALNVGQNVFPVANTDKRKQSVDQGTPAKEEQDPIALALAELKGAVENKQSTNRVSADRYHGISTPKPDRTQERSQEQAQQRAQSRAQDRAQSRAQSRAQERPQERPQERSRTQERTPERPQERTSSTFSRSVPAPRASTDSSAGLRGTPPPSYDTPVQRLGVPPPAVTSKAMQEATRKFAGQPKQTAAPSRPASVYNSAPSRPATRHAEVPRAASPAPPRSVSPRPTVRPDTRQGQRSASPNPYGGSHSPQPSISSNRGSENGYFRQNSPSVHSRTASPAPYRNDYDRPVSRGGAAMAVQLAPVGGEGSVYGSVRSRPGTSSSSRAMSFYEGRDPAAQDNRQRSRSVADPSRQYTPEGRAILHYARAMYMYQAAIPEELGFAKGDILAVLRHQDDGWWEAEIHSGNGVGRGGLVPSNYLQPC